jgi:hypothetical protein
MQLFSRRFVLLISFALLSVAALPRSTRGNDSDNQDVRISLLQGDVRLLRGDGKHFDLDKAWEQAQQGDSVRKGYALATGEGRAEIEFEDSSTAYVAEHSLLLFNEIPAGDWPSTTKITLVTGTATFNLEPLGKERFLVTTTTDTFRVAPPDRFFIRIDAYLDATGFTPQTAKGYLLSREDLPDLSIDKGQTLFFRDGEVVRYTSPILLPATEPPSDKENAPSKAMLTDGLPPLPLLSRTVWLRPLTPAQTPRSALAGDWDNWVRARVLQRTVVMEDALQTSGLSVAVPGLLDMYARGDFFPCGSYGTCWQAAQPDAESEAAADSPPSLHERQTPSSPPNAPAFYAQTVQWDEPSGEGCGPMQWRAIKHVARTQEELQRLLRLKAFAQSQRQTLSDFPRSCFRGYWIRVGKRYARVLGKPPKCAAKACVPVHPPRPVFVRIGSRIGLVPRHPDDAPGRSPLNLKDGVFILPTKPGETMQRLAWNPSQRFVVLTNMPAELSNALALRGPVAPPVISARLAAGTKETAIPFDYKTQTFRAAPATLQGTKPKDFAIGGVRLNGKVGSFAGSSSRQYASGFFRSGLATGYNGGTHEFGGVAEFGGHGFGSAGRNSGGFASAGGGGGHLGGFSGGGVSHGGGSGSAGGGAGHAH